MRKPPNDDSRLQIVLLNDDDTPWQVVVGLLQSVFEMSESDAQSLTSRVHDQGKGVCGTYKRDIANELLTSAESWIAAQGSSLKLVAEPAETDQAAGTNGSFNRCAFCGTSNKGDQTFIKGKRALICEDCVLLSAHHLSDKTDKKQFKYTHQALSWHFAGIPQDQLASTSRQFPGQMRADVQIAVDQLFSVSPVRFFGVFEQHRYETLTIAALTKDGQHAPTIAPAQYEDVDIGEAQPVRCLKNGLWLCREEGFRYAVLLSLHREYGHETGTYVEIVVPVGEEGSEFTKACFTQLEGAVNAARSYRGKVLSLDSTHSYDGQANGITVHRLPKVSLDEVILPDATLKLLERNVLRFVNSRDGLRALNQSTRKGILLYGPPGSGKTHTIRYLASNLEGHTTLIVTAAQMALLGQYMSLARLLQPTLVVLEDVDLIARERESMNNPCAESLLNELLNEMDGLKEDADILFILTTNRPEQLENALASRPGRIDQAIEVPLPDALGREKLVRLYGAGLKLSKSVISDAVKRSDGVSAAFIKEMMRRTAQASLERGGRKSVSKADLTGALDDMLFTGGRLNVKLLGGSRTDAD